jgi:hypothetical protein
LTREEINHDFFVGSGRFPAAGQNGEADQGESKKGEPGENRAH